MATMATPHSHNNTRYPSSTTNRRNNMKTHIEHAIKLILSGRQLTHDEHEELIIFFRTMYEQAVISKYLRSQLDEK